MFTSHQWFVANKSVISPFLGGSECLGVLRCNNGIGGLHENLVTFKRSKLPDFLWAQKMHLKKCSS